MYRIIFIICGLLLCSLLNTAQSQDYFVYTESGTRVDLVVQDSVISVKFGGGMQLWDGIFASETALSTDVPPEPLCDGFYRIRVVPGNDPESLVARLRARDDIRSACLSFLDENNNPI